MSLDPRILPTSQRPGSSLSHRSASRTSYRPVSRLSQLSKQPRLAPLLNTLVRQVTGFTAEDDSEDFREAVDLASKQIDQMKQATVPDLTQVEASYLDRVKRARINMQDTLANVMDAKYRELVLNVTQRKELHEEIKLLTLPHHLQLLMLLSSPPTTATLLQAEMLFAMDNRPVESVTPLTWEKILKEEPFEGQHWQGAYGLPEGSTVEQWDDESSDSEIISIEGSSLPEDPALSSEDEPLQALPIETSPEPRPVSRMYRSRELVEALQARQYWRSDWHTDIDLRRPFDIGDPSTLGPALSRILMQETTTFTGSEQESYINEIDAVREVLMVLQGRRSCLFQVGSNQDAHAVTVLPCRRIVHFTRASQASILTVFASYASTINPLRDLVRRTNEKATLYSSPPTARCRTFEAFSEAIDRQLLLFDAWCAEQEERIITSQQGGSSSNCVVSLLSLRKVTGARLSRTFHVLLSIVRSIEARRDRLTPPTLVAVVLNALLEAVRSCSTMGDASTAQCLVEVWRESTVPLWTNIERWLKDGIPVRVGFEGENYATEPTWDGEFFIRMNPLVDLASPDFWECGYTLFPSPRNAVSGSQCDDESTPESGIPSFLQSTTEDLLAAGKAIGLLRALNMLVTEDWLERWPNFGIITGNLSSKRLEEHLVNLMSETLLPLCRQAQSWFHQVLVDQCDLWKHVQNVEQVYLMNRGDAMSQFGEKLFARMDARQPWYDFHFLNSAFWDVTRYGQASWIDPLAVRISHRGTRDKSITRTVRAIDGLFIEYAVTFPLTYMFGPETNASYSMIFNFLLQIKRCKSILDRILIRGLNRGVTNVGMPDLKAFYALRNRLSWFVNTLMNFIMTNVIHAELIQFHKALKKAASLDEIISMHRSHLDRLLSRCLLRDNTSALHRAILSILDLSLHFSDCLSAYAGDTSLDVSRHSLLGMRHRYRRRGQRSRRLKKPDMIGFVEALPVSESETETDHDEQDETTELTMSVGVTSISFAEESFFARVEKMNTELDGLVRFVRRAVETLAYGRHSGQEGAATTFRTLAFSLEDWNL